MKGLLAGVLVVAATAQAGLVPVSSAVCLTNAIVATGCSATDNSCICTSDVFLTELAECAESSATSKEDAEKIVTIADSFCGSTGADVKGDLKKRWGGQWTNWSWGRPGRPGRRPWGRPGRGPWGRPGSWGGPWGRPGSWGGPWGRPGQPAQPAQPDQPGQPGQPGGWSPPSPGNPSPPSNNPSQPEDPSTPTRPWEDWGRPGPDHPWWGRPGSWPKPTPVNPEPPVNTVW